MGAHLTERRRFWRDHLLNCHLSGLTLKAYAQTQGLAVAQLYSWKMKLGRLGLLERDAPSPGALVPVRVVPDLRLADHCRIDLPNGIRLDWPLSGEPGRLGELLRVLEAHG